MKKYLGVILGFVSTFVAIVARLNLALNEQEYIIVHGIQAYKNDINISTAAILVFGLFTCVMGIMLLVNSIKAKKQIQEQQGRLAAEQEQAIEMHRKANSYLSASNTLVESVIRNHLQESYNGTWCRLRDALTPLYHQSEKMDELQTKLKSLITKNDASVLDDTEEVLEQAEQSLLKNIRKVMNYMDVCDPNEPDEVDKVYNSALECKNSNKVILDNVSDFLMALTEYLNNQGSDDGLDVLNSYKDALRGTSEQPKEKVLVENPVAEEKKALVFGEGDK
jgi:hypothetical protein